MTLLPAIAGLALAAGLAQLCTGHLGALVGFSMVQGIAVVLALLSGGWFGAALIVSILSIAAVPFLVARIPVPHARPVDAGAGARGWGLAVGTAGAALAVQVPVLGLPFAVVLAGLIAVVTRPEAGTRVLGLLAMQHGVALAACLQGDADALTILVAALPIAPMIVVTSMVRPWPGEGASS